MAKSKKSKQRRRDSDERSALSTFFIVCGVIILCGGILYGFWFLARFGPQEVDYSKIDVKIEVSEAAKAAKLKSLELEAEFEEVLAMRRPDRADMEILGKSLEAQEDYISQLPTYDVEAAQRRDALNKRYQDLVAGSLLKESLEIEELARGKESEEAYEEARKLYSEAYELQKEINEDYALSKSRNLGRATRLQRQARYLTAVPLYKQSLEFEEKATALIEEKNWPDAEEALQQAIVIQDQLNRDYRGGNHASIARSERLKTVLVGIRSGQSYVEIEKIANLADQRRAAGENLEAASLYQEASKLQAQLNKAYQNSPYASSEKVAEYQRKAQTAQSFELGLQIEASHDLLEQMLGERRTYEAAELIVSLRRDIKQMEDAYPRSSLNDEELQVKIRYLNLVQSDLGFIQDRIYDSVLDIPEESSWKMLKTEVPQALYALIMGTNPSRNIGDTNPVDSVSWVEAKSFCERVSWILGKSVRLPTENEFRQALGKLRYVVLEDHVWSASNAKEVAQSVGTKEPLETGYYDLLGNVSEWLESTDRFETEDAIHIGGHAQDRLDVIFTVPAREAPRGERNRMTGFRFVVDVEG